MRDMMDCYCLTEYLEVATDTEKARAGMSSQWW